MKAKVLILDKDGKFDEKEYDTYIQAWIAFRKIANLLVNDRFERVVRLFDDNGKVIKTFDSLTGKYS